MDQQNIIFPNAPLLIKHKGWMQPQRQSPAHLSRETVIIAGLDQFDAREKDQDVATMAKTQNSQATGETFVSGTSPTTFQDYTFVIGTNPNTSKDSELRKQVKSHVAKGVHREIDARKRVRRKSDAPAELVESITSLKPPPDYAVSNALELQKTATPLTLTLPGSALSFYGGIQFDMKPHFHKLLNYYYSEVARSIFPFPNLRTFNPAQQAWFPLALKDELLFYTFVYASAAHCFTFNEYSIETLETLNVLIKPVFQKLNKRLTDKSQISDATIGAVSCLAAVENDFGNSEKWRTHMAGMVEMIRVRGGLSSIEESLQMKIYRSDLLGAVDSLSKPVITPMKRTQPPAYGILPPGKTYRQSDDLVKLLVFSDVDSRLVQIFADISRFTDAIEHASRSDDVKIHPRSLEEDLFRFQYDLLTLPHFACGTIQEAARLAAIIYVKSIAREYPFTEAASSKIVQKLKHTWENLTADVKASRLGFWTIFMGGIASQSTPERLLIVELIAKLSSLKLEFSTWGSVENVLREVLWIPWILEKPGRRLWDEVERDGRGSGGRPRGYLRF